MRTTQNFPSSILFWNIINPCLEVPVCIASWILNLRSLEWLIIRIWNKFYRELTMHGYLNFSAIIVLIIHFEVHGGGSVSHCQWMNHKKKKTSFTSRTCFHWNFCGDFSKGPWCALASMRLAVSMASKNRCFAFLLFLATSLHMHTQGIMQGFIDPTKFDQQSDAKDFQFACDVCAASCWCLGRKCYIFCRYANPSERLFPSKEVSKISPWRLFNPRCVKDLAPTW